MENKNIDLKDEGIRRIKENMLDLNLDTQDKISGIKDRKTFKMESDILSRLNNFLPIMKKANEQLESKILNQNCDFILEKVKGEKQEIKTKLDQQDSEEEEEKENDKPMIHMDLGLGVFDTIEESVNKFKDVPVVDLSDEDTDGDQINKLIEEI